MSQACQDRIGVLVDWIDNYRSGDVDGLLATYEPDAIVDCKCVGMTFRTPADIGKYWRERIAKQRAAEILDLRPAGDTILLIYRAGAATIEAKFKFGQHGLIAACSCGPASGICTSDAAQSA